MAWAIKNSQRCFRLMALAITYPQRPFMLMAGALGILGGGGDGRAITLKQGCELDPIWWTPNEASRGCSWRSENEGSSRLSSKRALRIWSSGRVRPKAR